MSNKIYFRDIPMFATVKEKKGGYYVGKKQVYWLGNDAAHALNLLSFAAKHPGAARNYASRAFRTKRKK